VKKICQHSKEKAEEMAATLKEISSMTEASLRRRKRENERRRKRNDRKK